MKAFYNKKRLITVLMLISSTICSFAYDNWVIKTNMPYFTAMHTSGFSLNGHFFVINGTSTAGGQYNFNFEYDPVANTWTQRASLPHNISKLHAFSIGNFGYAGIGGYGGVSAAWYQYDYISNTWTAKSPFPGVCRSDGAAFAIGDYGYIVGGAGVGNYQVWAYHASTDTWIQKNNLTQTRRDAGCFVIGQKAYIVAGVVNNAAANDCMEYDPASDTWTAKAPVPGGNYYAGISFSIGNKGYFGFGDTQVNKFWEYNPVTDTWTGRNNNNAPASTFYWHCNSSFGTANRGFSGGPGLVFGSNPNNWYEYIPPPFVLPIELLSFDSHKQNEDVMVKWVTASETNNSYFVLEHSLNGLDFTEISQHEAAGTSNTYVNYQYIHHHPGNGMHYYRLRQYDFDGEFSTSKIVCCQIRQKDQQVNLWQSITENNINISELDISKQYVLQFYSQTGSLVYTKSFGGVLHYSIPLPKTNLPNGIYIFSIQCESRSLLSGKFVLNQI